MKWFEDRLLGKNSFTHRSSYLIIRLVDNIKRNFSNKLYV